MITARAAAVMVVTLAIVAAIALIAARGGDDQAHATVEIRFSRFSPGTVTVPAGEPVTITIENHDPIEHEWIVGAADVHARHRTGTEPYHDQVPTEVTVPALSSRETTITFEEPGEYAFICHLPGHEAYGMAGTLRVRS